MIDHPAMPKFDSTLPCRQLKDDGTLTKALSPRESAELTFRSVVKWLEDANIYRNTDYRGMSIIAKDWQSLREAAGLEKP